MLRAKLEICGGWWHGAQSSQDLPEILWRRTTRLRQDGHHGIECCQVLWDVRYTPSLPVLNLDETFGFGFLSVLERL